MVLSNKRLKKELRAAKAELITASGAENNFADKKYEKTQDFDSKASDSLKTILNLEAQMSRLSKRVRPKRVKQRSKAPTENADIIIVNGEISRDVEIKLQDGSIDTMQVDKKTTEKRKRDESESSENVTKKRKKRRPQKWWLVKKKKKDKNKTEEVENGAVKEEGVNQNESGYAVEKFVEKADELIHSDRNNVEISQKVYVGGIPYYSTEDDIRSYFESCGTITSIDCMTFPDTGKFRGIAMITFKTEAAAKRALALDGSDMGGLFLKIQPFKSARGNKLTNFSPSVLEGYNRIYVGNLSWDITENDLRNLFADCTIKSIRFGEDKETGEFKGYAHVDLADGLSLNKALKFDQTVVCGRPVRITCAVLKNDTASKVKPIPKDYPVASGKEVSAANLKATPGDYKVDSGYVSAEVRNQVDSYDVSAAVENQVNSSGADALSSKIRRRTCYECGERGHLSSSCPKNSTASKLEPMQKDDRVSGGKEVTAANLKATPEDNQVDWGFESAEVEYKVDYGDVSAAVGYQVCSTGANALNSKIRRRTCYECGERGHLSSSCPKNSTASKSGTVQNDNQVNSGNEVTAANLKAAVEDKKLVGNDYVSEAVENQVPNSGTNVLSSKIRRRTCYECGERGHLSSACPKKQGVADPTNPVRGRAAPPPTFKTIFWYLPAVGWVKINTDGSALGAPGLIAGGGVLRNACGFVLGCFRQSFGVGFSFEAELLASIFAVEGAYAMGWRRVWLEVDSTEVVRQFTSRSLVVPSMLRSRWSRVLDCIQYMDFQVTHIYREGNQVANFLASSVMEDGWWPYAHPKITALLNQDLFFSHCRRVFKPRYSKLHPAHKLYI